MRWELDWNARFSKRDWIKQREERRELARTHTQTHTHIHIYIYIYIYMCLTFSLLLVLFSHAYWNVHISLILIIGPYLKIHFNIIPSSDQFRVFYPIYMYSYIYIYIRIYLGWELDTYARFSKFDWIKRGEERRELARIYIYICVPIPFSPLLVLFSRTCWNVHMCLILIPGPNLKIHFNIIPSSDQFTVFYHIYIWCSPCVPYSLLSSFYPITLAETCKTVSSSRSIIK